MIVVGTTLTTFAMSKEPTWSSWLKNAEQLVANSPEKLQFFASIEVDARGIEFFSPLTERLNEIGGEHWTFTLDDKRTEVTGANRIRHITTGRNIVHDYAIEKDATHILFLDADMMPPDDTLPRLLEMEHPIVGGDVPTYCLNGPVVDKYPYPVQSHMNTAGFLLLERQVFERIKWRGDINLTDDPCFHRDVVDFLGFNTYVRKDVVGQHYPRHVPSITRRGYDMTVVRNA